MSQTFSLQLNIAPADLQVILAAGENIVLARVFQDSESNVAWLSFAPFENNEVSWSDEYGLYSSQQSGNVIIMVSTNVGIPSGTYYNFAQGQFQGPNTGSMAPPPGSYRVFNQMQQPPALSFGLVQSISGNGPASPLNVVGVPANQFATFTPLDAVYVWLQSNVKSGDRVQVPPPAGAMADVVGSISSRSTLVSFQGTTSRTYGYDPTVGAFVPAQG